VFICLTTIAMHKDLSLLVRCIGFSIGYWGLGNLLLASSLVAQEVTADGTTDTTVNSDGDGNFTIEQGDRAGNNLFHSFGEFSVPSNGSAGFNNATEISNIFSRVTGGNISNIDGLIQANGSANLFLINPAGIIFGNGARLDIGGSFYGSSASSILFEDGEFSATDLANPPLLTINAPIGLGFRDQPGDIVNRSNFGLTSRVLDGDFSEEFAEASLTDSNSVGLQVDPQKTLALIGGDIVFEDVAGITAPEGTIELGGLAEVGTITLNNDGSLTYPGNVARSNVSLTENSQVEVRGDNGGLININAKNLILSERSKIFAGIAEDSGSVDSQAGNITINATDSVKLIGSNRPFVGLGTEINNHVGTAPNRRNNPEDSSNATGNGGSIIINTNLLEISDQARITANSFSQGNGGDIMINTNNITMNGGAIAALVWGGIGDAGDVTVNNQDSIMLNEGSNIQSQVINDGTGDVGDIKINTGSFAINEKFSFVLADNVSAGNAGNITINARDSVFIDGGGGEELGTTLSAILSQVQTDVVGNAGDITIATPQLSLTNFALISTNVKQGSVGSTGKIFLDVGTLSLNNGAVIDALTENDFTGGSIEINADHVNLNNGGKIVTSGDSGGDAGNIQLNVADTITINNGNPPASTPFLEPILQNTALDTGIFASSVAGSTGNGGSIEINSGSIEFVDNGSIAAVTQAGTGGNIALKTREDIILDNNSAISAEAFNQANGGNLTIDSRFIIAFPNSNSDILADAQQGEGGNITINAESLLGIVERPLNDVTNDLNASSQFSLDGNVQVNTPDTNPTDGATELPVNRLEAGEQVAQTCSNNQGEGVANNLLLKGKGGLPVSPIAPLSSDLITTDIESAANPDSNQDTSLANLAIATSQGKIIPARGIVKTKDGRIILTATPTATTRDASRLSGGSNNCGQG
jgi:filamentous hemagglutinin family protein